MTAPISVLLVDDSPTALAILKRVADAAPGIDVVGTAANGEEALRSIRALHPQVVCTGLHMPRMGGLALVQEIMATCALPVLVVSVSVQKEDADNAFRLLEAGAVELCPKPRGGDLGQPQFAREFIRKVRLVAGVRVVARRRASAVRAPLPPTREPAVTADTLSRAQVVAIGASTGGPVALRSIFSELPADFPVPILCVQHINGEFLPSFITWLQSECRLKIRLAEGGEICQRGTIYFPPADHHLEVNHGLRLRLAEGTLVDGHCPSVTVTFRSVAHSYGERGVGVLLTGMGVDGAAGLAEIARAGGVTIAQDEATCVVFGMPGQAVALGAAKQVLPLPEIARLLAHDLRPRANAGK
jgi:two-component system chemotaxis response regulator CheB